MPDRWHPISTAPTDGTPFMGAWFSPMWQTWTMQPCRYERGRIVLTWSFEIVQPTMWQPMPEPPGDSQAPRDGV